MRPKGVENRWSVVEVRWDGVHQPELFDPRKWFSGLQMLHFAAADTAEGQKQGRLVVAECL